MENILHVIYVPRFTETSKGTSLILC